MEFAPDLDMNVVIHIRITFDIIVLIEFGMAEACHTVQIIWTVRFSGDTFSRANVVLSSLQILCANTFV